VPLTITRVIEGTRTTTAIDGRGEAWVLTFSVPSMGCTSPDACVRFARQVESLGARCRCGRPACALCASPIIYGWRSATGTYVCPWCCELAP
jgi:hypothetical protein